MVLCFWWSLRIGLDWNPITEALLPPYREHAHLRCDTPRAKGVSQRCLRNTTQVRIGCDNPSAVVPWRGMRRYTVASKTNWLQTDIVFCEKCVSNCRYRIMLPEELLSLQRQICGNVSRTSLIADTDSLLNLNWFLLQTQTSGSIRINSVIVSATTADYSKSKQP